MTEIIVIAAIAENNAIGKNGDIPWRIKEDFLHFKQLTMSYPCIMGDKTYESLPPNAKPLPGRENIVLTLDKTYKSSGTTIMHDFNEAISYCKKKGVAKAFITGGATIYKLGLKVADVLELTKIYKSYDADVFFPEIDFNDWKLEKKEDNEGTDVRSGEKLKFSYLTYIRKK